MSIKKILMLNTPYKDHFCRSARWAARSRARVQRHPDWMLIATSILEKEGHDVKFYFKDKDKDSKDVYDGFIDKINAWGSCQNWADVIIFDDECYGSFADKLRKKNKLIKMFGKGIFSGHGG